METLSRRHEPGLWLFDLVNLRARNLTQSPAAESIPMWHGDTLYFLSDRDQNKRFNIGPTNQIAKPSGR